MDIILSKNIFEGNWKLTFFVEKKGRYLIFGGKWYFKNVIYLKEILQVFI